MNERTEKVFAPTTDALQTSDLVCLSHLRWNFVFQRPQHLLSRAAQDFARVFFVEEPVFEDVTQAYLQTTVSKEGVRVCVPHLPHGCDVPDEQRRLLNELLQAENVVDFTLWFYTPMAWEFGSELSARASVVVFDVMDELAAFKFAPPQLIENEKQLMQRADVVFTGGQSLYEARCARYPHAHHKLHCFPSSIEFNHFAQARERPTEPDDQAPIRHPRFGFFGVVDERFDIELLRQVAAAKPEWQFVIIGPVVKIEDADLPRAANIHYLGGKDYRELPRYLAGWDVATLLFARNESTRFISPTKTPEYLAAGRLTISTSIHDVVRPYGEKGFVKIADTRDEFISAGEALLAMSGSERQSWLQAVDDFLRDNSWDKTWEAMRELIGQARVSSKAGALHG